ncbi:MAG TPA: chemotaxis protein CheB [Candidatus Binataceae bacterium]|nr:chemotaxis protein CheB [Candidatus Binataceae bacterium]
MKGDEDLGAKPPIVGVGASAGGVEATSELLEHLRGTSGLAVILVQHRDPLRESLLPELLAKKTDLNVVTASDGGRVEAGHLYLMPPDKMVILEDNRLRLIAREREPLPHAPIDKMLRSLASELGTNSIAVILSGTGTDGSRGLIAIKEVGGITFTQDEASAKFGGMPRSAIATGCVDFVLPPREIATELKRIISHPYQNDAELSDGLLPTDNEAELSKILQLLRTHTGIDFSRYRRSTIVRRLQRRIAVMKADDLAPYGELLRKNPAEAEVLAQDFLIAVTRFFRDTRMLEQLATTVFPALVANRSTRESIRIWVPGCATGEEVYSIGIALIEFLEKNSLRVPIQLFGTDLSLPAIDRARRGSYIGNLAAEVSEDRLERFFVKLDDHYRIVGSLREICLFTRHDVTRDPPFSHLDLISCQNFLVYFEPNLQREVLRRFHYGLRPQGFLVLGSSETIGQSSELFQILNRESRIYRRRSTPTPIGLGPESERRALQPAPRAKNYSAVADGEYPERESERILLARYAPTCILVNEDLNIRYFHGDTSDFLEHPRGRASFNLGKLIRPKLLMELSRLIRQARDSNAPARKEREPIQVRDTITEATLEVIPVKLRNAAKRYYLVVFERTQAAKAPLHFAQWRPWRVLRPRFAVSDKDHRIGQLEHELQANSAFLHDTIEKNETAAEELRMSREEALSGNQEIQSINAAKAELQSTNEELITTNEELLNSNRELNESLDALEESRNYLGAIIETMRESLLVLDGELRVITANHAFYQAFRVKPEDTISGLLYQLGNGQWNIPRLRTLLEEILPHSRSLRDFEVTHQFPELGKRSMVLNGRRLEGDSRRPARILLAIEDITEHRMALKNFESALQALRQEDRRTNEFLAVLAHELRNPLAPIKTAVQLMRNGGSNPGASKHLDIIDRQTGRMSRLVDDLLEISRVNQGNIVLRKERTDVGAVVNRAADVTRQQPGPLEVRSFVVSLPPSLLYIFADPVRVEQIISNLLDNSVKFTDAKGHISVRVERHDDEAVIRVVDDGIGISAEALPHVFKPFFQADSSFGRRNAGLGIGLTLAKRLVELHGGEIEGHSEGLGKGSEFVVRMPVASAAENSPEGHAHNGPEDRSDSRAAPRPLPAEDPPHHRILIVDDNIDGANVLAELLDLWGHEVAVAYEGRAALQLATSFAPDVVLLDLGLPGMDGLSVARELRQLPGGAQMRLVAMTGHARPEDRKASSEAGCDTHLVKPVNFDLLQTVLSVPKPS